MLFISKNLTLGHHVSLILRKMWEIGIFIHMQLCFLIISLLFSCWCFIFYDLLFQYSVQLVRHISTGMKPKILLTHSLSRYVISHSPYCLQYNFYTVSLENLVLDQLIISSLIFFFILITCLLDVLFI